MIPVLINSAKLKAAKGAQDMTYREIAEASGKSEQTICDVLAGCGTVELQSIAKIAFALGLGVVVDFVPLADAPADPVAELRNLMSSQVGLATSQAWIKNRRDLERRDGCFERGGFLRGLRKTNRQTDCRNGRNKRQGKVGSHRFGNERTAAGSVDGRR